jgi:predicted permease
LAVVAGVLVGVAPAVQSTGSGLFRMLKEGRSPGSGGGRTRAALIVMQTALSLALLAASGLLVQSLVRLHALDLGFDPTGLVTIAAGRSELDERALGQMAERLMHRPGVEGVSLASIAPFGATSMVDIKVPGAPFTPASTGDLPLYTATDTNYVRVMRMRVLRGRGFVDSDTAGSEPVALVNESMARRYWGGGSPFESCILAPGETCARVVGVVADVHDTPGGSAAPMRFYVLLRQSSRLAQALVVRADTSRLKDVAAAVPALAGGERPPVIEIVSERVARAVRPWRSAMLLFLSLGAIALALACVGIYSVMNYLVAERLHEMGIRLALGATSRDVVRLVLHRGVTLVGIGVALGIGAAAGLGRLIQALLFQVSTFEPGIYGAAAATMLVLSLAAMLPVALRAARVDPVETLRAE